MALGIRVFAVILFIVLTVFFVSYVTENYEAIMADLLIVLLKIMRWIALNV